MTGAYYLATLPLTLFGFWLLWFYGWQEFLNARFRDRLFSLRAELFVLAASGEIAFDNVIYCSLRFRLNALLRFAHRVSLASVILARFGQERSSETKTRQKRWDRELDKLPAETRVKVLALESAMHGAFASHVVWGSVTLIPVALLVRLSRTLKASVERSRSRKMRTLAEHIRSTSDVIEIVKLTNGVKSLEHEAYREERENDALHAMLA